MPAESPVAGVRQSSRPTCSSEVDPRVVRTRAAVLRAATDLLVEGGPTAVTIDAIVARSGVARSTIYRHWDTRDDVLLAVIESCAPHIELPDASLDFEAALRWLVADLCRILNDPDWSRVVPALLALRNQEHGIAEFEQRIETRQEHVIELVLQRGVAEGRLVPGFDLDQATALLVGPLLFGSLMDKPDVDQAFGAHIVEVFLRTYGAPASD